MKLKKLISFLLVCVFVLTMSVPVFAAEEDPTIGQVSNMTLSEVVKYLEDGGGTVDYSFLSICETYSISQMFRIVRL